MRGIACLTAWMLVLSVAVGAPGAPAGSAGEREVEAVSTLTGGGTPAEGGLPAPVAGPTEGAAEPTYPYRGKITADLVNIRCGPGLYYYPLTTLSKGDDVVVESEAGRWLAIRAPESVFGLMRTSDLAIRPGGALAAVTAPKARVYASGPSADRRWCVGSILEKDALVTVLGPAEGEFVRVAPPEDVRVYVVREYVSASGATAPDTGPRPAVGDVDVEPPEVNPLIEAFQKADEALKAELRKEMEQRDYDSVAAQYQHIAETAEKAYIKKAAESRLAYIDGLQQQKAEYENVVSLAERLDERLADIKTRYAESKAARDAEEGMGGPEFVAEGCVRKLESLTGVDYPVKYKLVDQNNRPLVVLKSSQYDLGDYVGKIVGVRGTKTYLKDWLIYCVTVDDLEVLEE